MRPSQQPWSLLGHYAFLVFKNVSRGYSVSQKAVLFTENVRVYANWINHKMRLNSGNQLLATCGT